MASSFSLADWLEEEIKSIKKLPPTSDNKIEKKVPKCVICNETKEGYILTEDMTPVCYACKEISQREYKRLIISRLQETRFYKCFICNKRGLLKMCEDCNEKYLV